MLKHNAMGKVPVILDGDVAVSETGAIITYMLDKYAPGELAPLATQPERGRYLKWLFFAPGVIEPCFAEKFFKWEVPPRSVAWGCFADMMSHRSKARFRRTSGWPAIVSPAPTSTSPRRSATACCSGRIPKEGVMADYVARCTDRPAFRRCAEIDERFVAQAQNQAAS